MAMRLTLGALERICVNNSPYQYILLVFNEERTINLHKHWGRWHSHLSGSTRSEAYRGVFNTHTPNDYKRTTTTFLPGKALEHSLTLPFALLAPPYPSDLLFFVAFHPSFLCKHDKITERRRPTGMGARWAKAAQPDGRRRGVRQVKGRPTS